MYFIDDEHQIFFDIHDLQLRAYYQPFDINQNNRWHHPTNDQNLCCFQQNLTLLQYLPDIENAACYVTLSNFHRKVCKNTLLKTDQCFSSETSIMENLFNRKKFEELLVSKWADFLDAPKLLKTINKLVDEHKSNFEFIPNTSYKKKGTQIMISRFQYENNGFIIWVDFLVPLSENQMAVGTTELFLLSTGIISHSKTLGNIYGSI